MSGTGAGKQPPQPKQGRTLVDFVNAKRRASCAVCSLPDAIRAQVRSAPDKDIPRRVVREWLEAEHGIKISEAEFQTHASSSAHREAA